MNRKHLVIGGFVVTTIIIIVVIIVVATDKGGSEPDPEPEPGQREAAITDCFPEKNANQDTCLKRGCLWQEKGDGSPYCIYPEGYGYKLDGEVSETSTGYEMNLLRSAPSASPYSPDIDQLTVIVDFQTDYRLRVRIVDKARARYEVPKEAVDAPEATVKSSNPLYDVAWETSPQFGLSVTRKSTNTTIFDTRVPGMIFSDQFIQLTTKLASSHLYGFGEHNHRQFKHDMDYKTWTIFTRDVAPVDEWNLYGAQPFYMNLEDQEGHANGVLLLNSNAMEVMLQPDPYPGVTFRVVGGVLDFYIFLGSGPEHVVQQYTEAFGRPLMPPYWSLGFQLSRWDYDNLTHVKEVVKRNTDAGIPLDVQYGDIDYMESKLDFTYDKDKFATLPDFVNELHDAGMKYIIILDHCIGSNTTIFDEKLEGVYRPYSEGLEQGIFIKNSTDGVLEGEVWPGLVYYPDFTLGDSVTNWWTDQCVDFYNGTDWSVEYDALWIDMNEPSNFLVGSTSGCEKNDLNYPPYTPGILGGEEYGLIDKTICMDAKQHWGNHYDVHNLYGHSMSITTWDTLRRMFPEKRPLVLTRSQFTGSQKYAMHWLGDNQSQWRQIPWSIVGMLEYSLFGFSYTGADICGFWFATTEEMCQRWMQLGAFYPFARNHNALGWRDQDPAAFSDEMIRVSRDILRVRYKLLPFLYTLMHEAHVYGSTVARPLLHEFPQDENTWSIDRQFLWGPSFMISPAMDEGQTEVEIYFPDARWYDYFEGGEVGERRESQNIPTPLDQINLHIRGGYILPWQEPANTTVFSRQNPMGITVALGDGPVYKAEGSLFWDDGEAFETFQSGDYLQVDFTCSKGADMWSLKGNVAHHGFVEDLQFDTINILGLPEEPSDVKLNDIALDTSKISYDNTKKKMDLSSLDISITSDFEISWR